MLEMQHIVVRHRVVHGTPRGVVHRRVRERHGRGAGRSRLERQGRQAAAVVVDVAHGLQHTPPEVAQGGREIGRPRAVGCVAVYLWPAGMEQHEKRE